MSIFQVQLNNVDQGQLDVNPSCCNTSSCTTGSNSRACVGEQFDPSIQRGVWIMGPNLTNRLLLDGATFTDCNYWKRFAYPQVPFNQAIVTVLEDDGSIYSDIPSENNFAVTRTGLMPTGSFSDTVVDFVGSYGGPATFVQLTNTDTATDATVELNGDTMATFTLAASGTQVFDTGDLTISKLRFSGSGADIDMIASVRSTCNS